MVFGKKDQSTPRDGGEKPSAGKRIMRQLSFGRKKKENMASIMTGADVLRFDFELDEETGKTLTVDGDNIIQGWGWGCMDMQLQVGDKVMQVDGKSADGKPLSKLLKTKQTQKLMIARMASTDPSSSSSPVFKPEAESVDPVEQFVEVTKQISVAIAEGEDMRILAILRYLDSTYTGDDIPIDALQSCGLPQIIVRLSSNDNNTVGQLARDLSDRWCLATPRDRNVQQKDPNDLGYGFVE